jgi:hypothetical protein
MPIPGIVANVAKGAINTVKNIAKPIGQTWNSMNTNQKVLAGGLGATGLIAGQNRGKSMNKMSEYLVPIMMEKLAKKTHPVSEHQRRWAWAAEERGELPEGKAHTWSKRVEGKDLPAKTSSDEIANKAFIEELEKLATEKGLKKLIKKIHKTHPEAFTGVKSE